MRNRVACIVLVPFLWISCNSKESKSTALPKEVAIEPTSHELIGKIRAIHGRKLSVSEMIIELGVVANAKSSEGLLIDSETTFGYSSQTFKVTAQQGKDSVNQITLEGKSIEDSVAGGDYLVDQITLEDSRKSKIVEIFRWKDFSYIQKDY